MGVRSTATATAPLAAVLLCGSLASCSNAQEETDTAMTELERAAANLSATALRPGAERAFARHGHPLPEGLACSTESPAPSQAPSDGEDTEALIGPAGQFGSVVPGTGPAFSAAPDLGPTFTAAPAEEPEGHLMVVCTGETEDGSPASLEAMLPRQALAAREEGDDGLPGDFVGRVGQEEVFTMDCLQCSPEKEQAPS